MKKRILFVTTNNLATNPRLVKELRLASDLGYEGEVIQFKLGNWSDALTQKIQLDFSRFRFHSISAFRTPFLPWLLSTLLEKGCRIVPFHWLPTAGLSQRMNKRSWLIQRAIQSRRGKFDWVIAHNPGAFFPASVAAKKFGAKLGIDVEDYHPGESNNLLEQEAMKRFMQRVLPSANYITYAAPMIAQTVQQEVSCLPSKHRVLVNGFLQDEFAIPSPRTGLPLRLVWFSQYIDSGRGLEAILAVVDRLHPRVQCTLIGSARPSFYASHIAGKRGIVVVDPLPQRDLHLQLADYDVGLATDLPVNPNRDMAITNKLIAYAQAGLMIAALPTKGQQLFLQESQLAHVIMSNDVDSIEQTFCALIHQKEIHAWNPLQQQERGMKFSWDELSTEIAALWLD